MNQAKRNKEAHVRFTEEEYARLKLRTEATGRSIGEFIRTAALNENPVHICDGKKAAIELAKIHNKIILYHDEMKVRMDALRESVQAYTTMMKEYGQGLPCSPTVKATAELMNYRVEAAVNTISHAYREFETRIDDKLVRVADREQL